MPWLVYSLKERRLRLYTEFYLLHFLKLCWLSFSWHLSHCLDVATGFFSRLPQAKQSSTIVWVKRFLHAVLSCSITKLHSGIRQLSAAPFLSLFWHLRQYFLLYFKVFWVDDPSYPVSDSSSIWDGRRLLCSHSWVPSASLSFSVALHYEENLCCWSLTRKTMTSERLHLWYCLWVRSSRVDRSRCVTSRAWTAD